MGEQKWSVCTANLQGRQTFLFKIIPPAPINEAIAHHGSETMNFNVISNLEMVKRRHEREETSTLGGRLRKRRKELGWTQMHLAELVGTSQAVIQKIENGKSLRPRILEEIAESLGVKPAWLQFGVEEVGELDSDAIELARAWAKLAEPHRTAMKEAILKIGAEQAAT